jgi:hypothetical protein
MPHDATGLDHSRWTIHLRRLQFKGKPGSIIADIVFHRQE